MSELKITCLKTKDGAPKEAAVVFLTKELLPEAQKTFPLTKKVWEDFKAEAGETVTVYTEGEVGRFLLCGLGGVEALELEDIRRAAVSAGDALAKLEVKKFRVLPFRSDAILEKEATTAALEGFLLRGYEYKADFTPRVRTPFEEICFITAEEPKEVKPLLAKTKTICEGVILARELANAPHSQINAERLAQVAKSLKHFGLKVKVLEMEDIKKKKMAGLLAVNRGSTQPARFIELEWQGTKNKKEAPVVFVGKGLTFDSGGISIKGSNGMEAMRMDKHGGASVIGTLYAAAALKVKQNVVGLVPATNNMPGPNALLPGDVIEYKNGVSVEIISTDAEGRLILADGLIRAGELKPKAVIDIATLTGAIITCLGYEAAGLFCEDEKLSIALKAAGEKTGERLWQMPMYKGYEKLLKSYVADIKNGGGRPAGSSTAALFLKKFAPAVPWAHVDIAAMGMRPATEGYNPMGATGYGVRLFIELLEVIL